MEARAQRCTSDGQWSDFDSSRLFSQLYKLLVGTHEAHVMRIARNLQITLKQFAARVLSLSTLRFQDLQRTSNSSSNGVCQSSQLPETVEITKSSIDIAC